MTKQEKDALLRAVRRYVKRNYKPEDSISFSAIGIGPAVIAPRKFDKGTLSEAAKEALQRGIQQMMAPGFRELLLDFIQKKGLRNAELYQRSDITKAHFSKIKNDEDYHPSKDTVLALALGLKLTFDETQELLNRAGYALTKSSKTDLIVTYFIRRQIYNVDEVNEILDEMGLPTITNHRKSHERKEEW